MLTIALSKGRILEQTIPLLKAIGIELLDDPFKSRKLIFATNLEHVRAVVIRATDVPTYVQFGAADLGILGKDGLMEHGGEGLCELLDLGISRCRLMTARRTDHPSRPSKKRLRVATKYPNLARKYYQSRGVQAEIIKLYGAMELAPLVGLADEIVDLVETGSTLKANNLVPHELIAQISCRLIANAASMRTQHSAIQDLVSSLQRVTQK